jgi:hypothetical protein
VAFHEMPLEQLMDEVAEYWRNHRGLNVLRLPRGATNAWELERLVDELDRVCIGVRSIEISWLQPCVGGGGMYMSNGPALVDGDNAAVLRVPLELSAFTTSESLGADAVTRLVVANRCPAKYCWEGATLASLQRLFPALRDVVSASEMVAPVRDAEPVAPLRPLRVLHLLGGYNFAEHRELLEAMRASPGLLSLAVKEVSLEQDVVFGIPGEWVAGVIKPPAQE